ncbi:PREDICTED: interferon omega-1-like [Acanthisitta chloris]|uniref:interferon omega-1-like n=1 Tax=Acanthisitta chloris TaxID=57068 RepID=UPI0004F0EEBF|nr:PREDICTED: interferon omega-1-like [Acanthisitta chloris]
MTILVQGSFLQVCIMLALYMKISHSVCLFQGINVNYHNMNLMRTTGGYFPQQCLSKTTDFRFPMEITKVTQKNMTMIIYEFLQQIFQLFSKNFPADAYNTSKMETFQNGINYQIEELETCLLEEQSKARNSFETWILQSATYSIKKYFQRINKFLKDKQYSHCSWEVVQMELRTCHIIFDSLINKKSA